LLNSPPIHNSSEAIRAASFTSDKDIYTANLRQTYKSNNNQKILSSDLEAMEPSVPRSDETVILPVRGLNIPFADVALHDGDIVIVERLQEQLITIVGLVNRPGTFPYPPDVEYNLMQVLGLAGGLNLSAEPRYATVYRLRADGTTTSFTFNIIDVAKSKDPTYALSIPLKPYDVVAVEHTPRTRVKVFWDRVFRFYLSTYLRIEDILGYGD
jgi:protein involved in polysaccharide export with SLBB domain